MFIYTENALKRIETLKISIYSPKDTKTRKHIPTNPTHVNQIKQICFQKTKCSNKSTFYSDLVTLLILLRATQPN